MKMENGGEGGKAVRPKALPSSGGSQMWAEKAETSLLAENVAPTTGVGVGGKRRGNKEHGWIGIQSKLHMKVQSEQEEGLTSSEKRGLGMEEGKQNRGDRKGGQDRAMHRASVLSATEQSKAEQRPQGSRPRCKHVSSVGGPRAAGHVTSLGVAMH